MNKYTVILLSLLVSSTLGIAQDNDQPEFQLSGKSGGVRKAPEGRPDTLTKFRTGILVHQGPEGIVYKSHLRNYEEITVELLNKKGEQVFAYKNELQRNVSYNLSVGEIPAGEYILRFSMDDRLVICNLRVSS